MFYRWGRFAYRHRKIIPVAVVALILLMQVLFGSQLANRLSQEGWEDPRADSTIGAQIEQDTFGRDNTGDVILIGATKDQGQALREQFPQQIEFIQPAQGFVTIGLAGDGEQTLKDYRAIQPALEELRDTSGVKIAGATAIADELDRGMADDIARAEKIGLVFVAIILLIVFGGVVAAGMPLIVGILSIIGSLSVLAILAQFQQVNVFSQSIITLLGLGLAIDYGLFMVSRFREELSRIRSLAPHERADIRSLAPHEGDDIRSLAPHEGDPAERELSSDDIEEAVAETTATAGETVIFSALMIGVALSGLLMFPQAFLKSVAYGAISAVVFAAIISVTVLPSIFGLLGPNIDKFSIRRVGEPSRFWAQIPAWAMKNSKLTIVTVGGALVLLTVPIAGITFGGINESYLPPSNAVRQAQDQFNADYPQYRTDPIKLVIEGADDAQLGQIVMQTRQVTGLASPLEPSQATKDGINVLSGTLEDRNGGEAVVKQLRAIDAPEGVELYVAGTPAMEVESIEALLERLPWMALYMIVATFILMAIVFRSAILPAKAVIMNALGIGATLGFLTLVFVNGVGSGVFNFTPGPLMSPVLVLIIAILYGLSTDYEVFLVSRMVEARRKGASTDRAIIDGTSHTGSIITAAAAIMIVVAAAFAMSDIVMMKYISFGLIFSLALDATLIRLALVPAVMHELREDNWWAPRWMRRAPAAPAAPQRALPSPAQPETAIDNTVLTPQHARSGVSVEENSQLIPFDELMKRLNGPDER
ncbi:MMPL family transporter [Corynebacterium aquatimens]|uniref:RND superfamily putative drug exporter n=1 Tax=Corynebacterium aquatimens TaxID=1190508 RepID=A0A931E2Q9_9CORY|nr:MMPL family transporter [Corynebacterium aquatimens]MBG6122857.1 RND superfamily putative drug exporter [Corynebacterium aquatimens]WJY66808.1 Membrane protein YdfJ [Corynebacterium aquatimens]